LTIETDNETQATSTITEDARGMELSSEQMMIRHPDLVKKFIANNPVLYKQLDDNSKTTAVSPNQGVDGS
jgi:hypothetical protein